MKSRYVEFSEQSNKKNYLLMTEQKIDTKKVKDAAISKAEAAHGSDVDLEKINGMVDKAISLAKKKNGNTKDAIGIVNSLFNEQVSVEVAGEVLALASLHGASDSDVESLIDSHRAFTGVDFSEMIELVKDLVPEKSRNTFLSKVNTAFKKRVNEAASTKVVHQKGSIKIGQVKYDVSDLGVRLTEGSKFVWIRKKDYKEVINLLEDLLSGKYSWVESTMTDALLAAEDGLEEMEKNQNSGRADEANKMQSDPNWTSEDSDHKHSFQVDRFGNGFTTVERGHAHEIQGFHVLASDKHRHSIPVNATGYTNKKLV